MLAEAANASLLNWAIAIEDGEVALMRYTLDLRDDGVVPDAAALDARIARMVRGWVPAVEAALAEHDRAGARDAARAAPRRVLPASLSHRQQRRRGGARHLAPRAARDPRRPHRPAVPRREAARPRLKIYRLGGALALSDAVPVLENFGFRVLEEVPTALADEAQGFVHEFLLEAPAARCLRRATRRVLEDAIAAVLEGHAPRMTRSTG